MLDLKISAVVAIGTSATAALVQTAQGHSTPSSIFAAIGFGGIAGFATTFMVIGSYKARVDRHEKLLEQKLSKQDLEPLATRIDDMHKTLDTIVKPILERHFRGPS
jgi:hypothetical protein